MSTESFEPSDDGDSVNIDGLDLAVVVAALYNNAVIGGGMAVRNERGPITVEQARHAIDERRAGFDYLFGRRLKLRFNTVPLLDVGLYNLNNGDGLAQRVIAELRADSA